MAVGRPSEFDGQARETAMEANLLNRNGSIGAAPGEPAGKKARSRSGQAHAKAGTAFKAINLALQGGGAHGAFTWGVLDRLLEDERIDIEGISGTSAGAMNAAVLAQGFARDGKEGARKALDDFWDRIASYSTFAPIRRSAIDRMFG